MSHSLQVSPLPTMRHQEHSQAFLMEQEGFVDEEVISALVSAPFYTRSVPCPEDLALSLDDMDFAGWHAAKPATMTRAPEVPPQVIDAIVRHSRPTINRSELDAALAASAPRWWSAALMGAAASLAAAAIFLSVSPGPRKVLKNFFTHAATVLSRAEPLETTPHAEEVFEP